MDGSMPALSTSRTKDGQQRFQLNLNVYYQDLESSPDSAVDLGPLPLARAGQALTQPRPGLVGDVGSAL